MSRNFPKLRSKASQAGNLRHLLLRLRNIWRQIFFAAAHCRHKTDPVMLRNYPRPSVLIDITPAGEMTGRTGLGIPFRRKKEELHAFFHYPDLGDALSFLVIEDTASERTKIRELRRYIVMG